jgi:hypothetical protein
MFSLEFKLIVAGVLLAAAAAFTFGWGEHRHLQGVQEATDRYELALGKQKAEAAGKLAKLSTDLVLAQASLREFTHSLEKSREDLQRKNDSDLRARRAGPKLQFVAEGPGCGRGGGGPEGTEGAAPGDAAATVIQLPDLLNGDLLQFAANAQSLAIDYGTLYEYVNNPRIVCELRPSAP